MQSAVTLVLGAMEGTSPLAYGRCGIFRILVPFAIVLELSWDNEQPTRADDYNICHTKLVSWAEEAGHPYEDRHENRGDTLGVLHCAWNE